MPHYLLAALLLAAGIPTITSVASITSTATSVSITGTDLQVTTGAATTVTVGSTACTGVAGTATALTCTLASALSAGTPTVTVAVGPSSNSATGSLEVVGEWVQVAQHHACIHSLAVLPVGAAGHAAC